MRITGTIRKWTSKGWGLANVYPDRRFFVHVSNAASQDVQLALGLNVRISFDEGAPRNPGDLPAALNIELAPIPPRVDQISTTVPVTPRPSPAIPAPAATPAVIVDDKAGV